MLCDPCQKESDSWVDDVFGGSYWWRRFSQDTRRRYDRLSPPADDYYQLVRTQLRLIRDACLERHQVGAP